MKKLISTLILSASLFLIPNIDEAAARKWKPAPLQSAQDYLNINHKINDQDEVFLMWVAPEYLEKQPATKPIRDVLSRYVLVGIVHFTIDGQGVFKFRDVNDLTVELPGNQVFSPMNEDELPPILPTVITFLSKALAGGMGKMGQAMKFYVYDTGNIDTCSSGTVWVRYLKERYEYKTPLPNC